MQKDGMAVINAHERTAYVKVPEGALLQSHFESYRWANPSTKIYYFVVGFDCSLKVNEILAVSVKIHKKG